MGPRSWIGLRSGSGEVLDGLGEAEGREGSTLGKKENSMESPTLAFMSLGENFRAPLPTSTEMVAAVATAAEAAATRAVDKYMLRFDIFSSECC
jgi:hypothetical protein